MVRIYHKYRVSDDCKLTCEKLKDSPFSYENSSPGGGKKKRAVLDR